MDPRYRGVPLGPADSVPISVFDAFYPGQKPVWIPLATGQRRLALERQIAENRAAERRAMKKYRAWRKGIYERSLTAIRLLDLSYLPMVEHPFRDGELTYDLELPLRDRHGEQVFCAHASNVEELELAIQHWFAALTYPTRAREEPEQHAPMHPETEEAERVRVADHYVRKIFHEDLPVEQRDALLAVIFQCKWFDIPPTRLRNYFRGVMRKAAVRRYRIAPMRLGGVPAMRLDEPLQTNPTATLMDTVPDPHSGTGQDQGGIGAPWRELWQFCSSIPPSQPKLRKMAGLLLNLLDEKEAVQHYGSGGLAQLKHLKLQVRAWRETRGKATG